jgi:hypothetical protein
MILALGRPQRYETKWEGFRLVVEECPDYWQAYVYDPKNCEVLYTAPRISLDDAKIASVAFAAGHVFGPGHGLKFAVVAAMLVWEPV